MTPSTLRRPFGTQGFSLVELLTVLAVIGILTTLALPLIAGPTSERVAEGRDRHNAQNLAKVYAAAQVAGVDLLVPNDLVGTIDRVVSGATATDGILQGANFVVPGLDPTTKTGAAQFLALSGDRLVYDPR